MNDDEYECLNTIASLKNVKYLKNNAEFALGIVTGNNSEFVKKSKSKNAEIVLRGSDIYRYEIKSTDIISALLLKNFSKLHQRKYTEQKKNCYIDLLQKFPCLHMTISKHSHLTVVIY